MRVLCRNIARLREIREFCGVHAIKVSFTCLPATGVLRRPAKRHHCRRHRRTRGHAKKMVLLHSCFPFIDNWYWYWQHFHILTAVALAKEVGNISKRFVQRVSWGEPFVYIHALITVAK